MLNGQTTSNHAGVIFRSQDNGKTWRPSTSSRPTQSDEGRGAIRDDVDAGSPADRVSIEEFGADDVSRRGRRDERSPAASSPRTAARR
jgi:hypothetical protein